MRLLQGATLTFTRHSLGYYDDSGKYVEGATSTVDSIGSLQPYLKGQFKLFDAAGVTSESDYLYFSKTELVTSEDVGTKGQPDTVSIKGAEYEVFAAGDWAVDKRQRSWHYKYLLKKIGDTHAG